MPISAVAFLVFLAYYLIARFLVRELQRRNSTNALGTALAYLD